MTPEGRPEASAARPDPAAVLSLAVVRAMHALRLPQATVAKILGLSPATVSRLVAGGYRLDPQRKEWELAALFLRVFRALDSIVGGSDEAARAWVASGNDALNGVPAQLLQTTEGLVRVAHYLDAVRGRL